MFGPDITAAAKAHAIACYPRESIGMVVAGHYHEITNESRDPHAVAFDEHYARRHGSDLEALIHSHPAEVPYPSVTDQAGQMAWAVPWGITVCNERDAREPFFWGDQVPRPPLVVNGKWQFKAFRWFVDDCYSLVRDIYWQDLKIRLPDFVRDWGEWKPQDGKPGWSGYDANYRAGGFEKVTRPQPYDLAIMNFGVPQHAAVLLPGNMIAHHMGSPDAPYSPQHPSYREPLGRYIATIKRGGYWLRYKGDKS